MPAVFGQSFTSNPSSAKAVPIENTLIAKALACSMSVLLIKAINTSSNAKQGIAASVSDTTMPSGAAISLPVVIGGLIAAVCGFALTKWVGNGRWLVVVSWTLLIALITYPAMCAVYTLHPFGNTASFLGKLFYFDHHWGTDRGYLWRSTVAIFADGSFAQKLFGRGTGSFLQAYLYDYSYGIDAIEMGLYSNEAPMFDCVAKFYQSYSKQALTTSITLSCCSGFILLSLGKQRSRANISLPISNGLPSLPKVHACDVGICNQLCGNNSSHIEATEIYFIKKMILLMNQITIH